MTIAHYTPSLPPVPGGVELHVKALSTEQAKSHKVAVFFIKGRPLPPPILSFRLRPLFWSEHLHYLFMAPIHSPLAAFVILLTNRRHRFDTLHVHGDFVEAAVFGLLGKLFKIPTVITIHYEITRKSVLAPFCKVAYRQPHAIICVSSPMKRFLMELGIEQAKISVISTGIPYRLFAEAEPLTAKPWKVTLLFVGRLHPLKGLRTLIQAMEILGRKHQDLGLLVAGDGPDRHLLLRAQRRGLPIKLLGGVEREKLPSIYASADIFVMPSETLSNLAEGVPTSILEAMAAALPIVATRSGGIPDIVEDTVQGLLVRERDPVALAGAIEQLVGSEELRALFGQRGRERAKHKDLSVIADQIEVVYQKARETC